MKTILKIKILNKSFGINLDERYFLGCGIINLINKKENR
jgi:hypothetical protein